MATATPPEPDRDEVLNYFKKSLRAFQSRRLREWGNANRGRLIATYSDSEVAEMIGIHVDNYVRWLEGRANTLSAENLLMLEIVFEDLCGIQSLEYDALGKFRPTVLELRVHGYLSTLEWLATSFYGKMESTTQLDTDLVVVLMVCYSERAWNRALIADDRAHLDSLTARIFERAAEILGRPVINPCDSGILVELYYEYFDPWLDLMEAIDPGFADDIK